MKLFVKVFVVSFACFVILLGSMFWAFNAHMKEDSEAITSVIVRAEDSQTNIPDDIEKSKIDIIREKANKSDRVNFVLQGIEGYRSDTMLFISFSPSEDTVLIVSIPRDTYYPRKGFVGPGEAKINAVFGDHGSKGVKTAVSDLLLDIPVDYYITVRYSGAEAIINSLGGVPMNIPHLMIYEDTAADPPLKIHFEPGHQVLNGKEGVQFLRYRQATPGSGGHTFPDGDLGRIKSQQAFMKSAARKALSFRLPAVLATAFKFVKTDIDLQDLLRYASNASDIKMDGITFKMLPGEQRYMNGSSYFMQDFEGIIDMLHELYAE
ncbi:MAG: LCP family protein [Clostridiales bacterium]|nr:LCP family protein [Clostridiales bacterium]